jgi:hypothetical protein
MTSKAIIDMMLKKAIGGNLTRIACTLVKCTTNLAIAADMVKCASVRLCQLRVKKLENKIMYYKETVEWQDLIF